MVAGVLFVRFGFALRTFVAAAPVAADLLIEHVIGSQLRPFGMREFLLYFFQEAVVEVGSQRRIDFAGRRTRHSVSTLDLPANVGGAIHGLARQWRSEEH